MAGVALQDPFVVAGIAPFGSWLWHTFLRDKWDRMGIMTSDAERNIFRAMRVKYMRACDFAAGHNMVRSSSDQLIVWSVTSQTEIPRAHGR